MTTPTAHWHAEHVNFARLLNVLEQQLQAFHQDEHPDYALMLDICDYLQNFPDVYHHPREDVASCACWALSEICESDTSVEIVSHRLLFVLF